MSDPAAEDQPGRAPASLADLRAIAGEHLISCAADPAGWRRLLAAAAANGRLGFFNAALIDAQQPDAGPAASQEDWATAGWQARQGQHARVWIITEREDRTEAGAVLTRDQVRPSRTGSRPRPPGTTRLSAGSAERALGALVALARIRGYAVTRPEETAAVPATDRGQHSITIPASMAPAGAAAALAHQLAHIIRDDEDDQLAAALAPGEEPAARDRPHQPGEATADCYGAAAAGADSAAWLVLTRLGVDPAEAGITFRAARTWAGTDPRSPPARAVAAAGERIVATANEITAHASKVLADLPDPTPAQVSSPAAKPRTQSPQPSQAAAGRGATAIFRPAWPVPDQDLVRVNGEAAAYFRANLPRSWAATYLRSRGFGADIARRWQLGYAPGGWTRLLDHLRASGYPDALILAAGLARRSSRGSMIDVFRNRVMFPIRGAHGQIVAFAGRAADKAPEGTPKYLNTPTTDIWHKDHVLYGLAEGSTALMAGARPVLVEGYLDTIAVAEAGHPGYWGIAPGGTALSEHQMAALAAMSDLRVRTPLLVVLDPDAAGRKAAIRDFPLISLYSPAATTPALPEGADPAEIFQKGGPKTLAAALAAGEHPLADVAVDAAIEPWKDKLEWPEGQLGAMRAAAGLIADGRPADPARQVERIAEQTGIPFAEIADEVRAALESRPKGQRGPDQMLRVHGTALDYPAGPTAATRNGSRRPPPQPGSPGGRNSPRRH